MRQKKIEIWMLYTALLLAVLVLLGCLLRWLDQRVRNIAVRTSQELFDIYQITKR